MKDNKPKPGTVIQVNWRPVFSTNEGPNWVDATVFENHSSQFTAFVEVDGRPLKFCFYNDMGTSWQYKS